MKVIGRLGSSECKLFEFQMNRFTKCNRTWLLDFRKEIRSEFRNLLNTVQWKTVFKVQICLDMNLLYRLNSSQRTVTEWLKSNVCYCREASTVMLRYLFWAQPHLISSVMILKSMRITFADNITSKILPLAYSGCWKAGGVVHRDLIAAESPWNPFGRS